jgi:hypothetical protein
LGKKAMTPLHPKHAEDPVLFFIPLLDQEFDETEDGALVFLQTVYH